MADEKNMTTPSASDLSKVSAGAATGSTFAKSEKPFGSDKIENPLDETGFDKFKSHVRRLFKCDKNSCSPSDCRKNTHAIYITIIILLLICIVTSCWVKNNQIESLQNVTRQQAATIAQTEGNVNQAKVYINHALTVLNGGAISIDGKDKSVKK